MAIAMAGWTALAASNVYTDFINPEDFNEDQKKINSEYKTTSSKCERTLEQVKKIVAETNTEIENLNWT